jgi:phosphoribosylanthranilate isomerase
MAAMRKDRLSAKLWYSRWGEYVRKTTLRRPLVVAVFQDQTAAEINDIVERTGVDLVQLHGDEPASLIEAISVPCIKVLHVSPKTSPTSSTTSTATSTSTDAVIERLKQEAEEFSGKAIALLLDSRLPGAKGGGTGSAFDWSIASKLNGIPVLLAGGLTAENAGHAAATAGVIGVDVSSGVESSPGKKDAQAVRAFVTSARS